MRLLAAVAFSSSLLLLPALAHADDADGGVPAPSPDAGAVAIPDAGPPPPPPPDAAPPPPPQIDAAPPVVITQPPPPERHHEEPEPEYKGTLGMREAATVGLWVGPVKNTTSSSAGTPPVKTDKTDSGQMGLVRIDFGGNARMTRFGSLVGYEFSTAFGFFTSGIGPGKSLSSRLFWDLDAILDVAFMHSGSHRVMFQGGAGLNLDAYYLIAGAKIAASIGHGAMAIELGYQYRRGTGWGADAVGEHRGKGLIILSKHKVGIGAEYWRGHDRRADGSASGTPALRGAYQAILGILSYRWKQ